MRWCHKGVALLLAAGISLETVVESISKGCRIDAKGTTAWIGAETMPIHDWTRVEAGLFHAFRLGWICALSDSLNAGTLPPDYYCLVEPSTPGSTQADLTQGSETEIPDEEVYARMADRLAVWHQRGQIMAVIEIISPGNKSNRAGFRSFVEKSTELIEQGVHLLVIDLFPPSERDPQGIHPALWGEFEEAEDAEFTLPSDKPLTLASYDSGPPPTAYIESIAVGDVLPEMPLFLEPERYVLAPLEATYQISWSHFPAALKGLLDAPRDNP
jgi:hypothetical protein